MTTTLDERIAALRDAATLARGIVEYDVVAQAEAVVARTGTRLGLGLEATVAALAGPTGAGKSTLFNALAGREIATPGHRRPTTATPTAAVWGDVGDDLLDWLEVGRRHRIEGEPSGLVLLDLPDFDSIAVEHRIEADRVIELADLVVWVVDPQKYADAVLHDRYLRPLASRRDAMLVALNQADRLDEPGAAAARADLERLLAQDGLEGVPVLALAAVDDTGVDALREELRRRVARREEALVRIAADATDATAAIAAAAGTTGSDRPLDRTDEDTLVTALASAAGVPTIVRAARRAHRRRGALATGWPVVRGLRRLRPDPLRRLRVGSPPPDDGTLVPRTSSAPASGVQTAQVATALRATATRRAGDLPEPWPRLLRQAALRDEDRLPDLLDAAVGRTDLRMRTPFWWRIAGALQWLLLTAAAIGTLWLLALAALGFLHLQGVVPTPEVEQLPVPTLLAVGGALAGVLVALVCGFFNRFGANRRARVAERQLRTNVLEVARTHVLAPLDETIHLRRRLLDLLATAAGSAPHRRGRRRASTISR